MLNQRILHTGLCVRRWNLQVRVSATFVKVFTERKTSADSKASQPICMKRMSWMFFIKIIWHLLWQKHDVYSKSILKGRVENLDASAINVFWLKVCVLTQPLYKISRFKFLSSASVFDMLNVVSIVHFICHTCDLQYNFSGRIWRIFF